VFDSLPDRTWSRRSLAPTGVDIVAELDTSSNALEDYVRYVRRHSEEYERLANSS
jgi:hypothetical protein